jgi:hypothetical protein
MPVEQFVAVIDDVPSKSMTLWSPSVYYLFDVVPDGVCLILLR